MSSGIYLQQAEKIFHEVKEPLKIDDINQIIELYNICCYIDADLYLTSWTAKDIRKYKEYNKMFNGTIGKYFSKINTNNIWAIYSETDIEYLDDFWKLFEKFKVYERISGDSFKNLLTHERLRISDVLTCKVLVNHYDQEITNYLMANSKNAEWLLIQYAELRSKHEKKYYFPKGIDKTKLLTHYIEDDLANPNYLKLICETQSTADLAIPAKVKLMAKRAYKRHMDEIFKDNSGSLYSVGVSFRSGQEEVMTLENSGREMLAVYSREWIKQNQDYPTLLNNFIYLFAYTDMQFRIQHVSKDSQMGVFERTLGVKGKKEYLTGMAFNQLQGLAMLQLIAYNIELEDINIRVENIIEWFFRDYLKEEFEANGFYITLPSAQTTYFEKCRIIIPEIDSILKQFKLFVEEGEIDPELLQLSSSHLFFNDISSLIKDKYIYGNGEEYNMVSYYLFSDQSPLYHIKMHDKYEQITQLLQNENLKREDFTERQISRIDWLLENNYLYINEKGYLKLDLAKVGIIRELFNNEVLSASYMELFWKQIEELLLKKVIVKDSTLFSKPEQDYFNYLLNQAEFSNGLDLRNRYVHGTQSTDEKSHEQDYYKCLQILILIVIKINEEFCLKADIENNE
ncbi:hypothetical protein [Robinsoniella peoriensis]|uniref:hypothetical protein n=1 Tax=Robinsoniella peoriensis TaxID=180332 RepID=UPI0009F3721F|nr:hypothetical protein [Robinsoniella peoriensis]